MDTPTKTTNVKHLPASAHPPMTLDMAALDAARKGIDQGAVTPGYAPWRTGIIALLNDSLATELVCVLRYKRHHFTAHGLASPQDRRRVHGACCCGEPAHADLIARAHRAAGR